MNLMSCIPILLAVLSGALLMVMNPKSRRVREIYTLGTVILTSVAVAAAIILTVKYGSDATACTLVRLESGLTLSLKIDTASMIFGGLVAALWPLTTVYAFEYMRHEGRENKFFSFFNMSKMSNVYICKSS